VLRIIFPQKLCEGWVFERFFARKELRRIATRWQKTKESFKAMIDLVSAAITLK
jgi:transposase